MNEGQPKGIKAALENDKYREGMLAYVRVATQLTKTAIEMIPIAGNVAHLDNVINILEKSRGVGKFASKISKVIKPLQSLSIPPEGIPKSVSWGSLVVSKIPFIPVPGQVVEAASVILTDAKAGRYKDGMLGFGMMLGLGKNGGIGGEEMVLASAAIMTAAGD
ncbi:hypothetical protein ACFL1M_02040 [Patescibacteria group bacterium]